MIYLIFPAHCNTRFPVPRMKWNSLSFQTGKATCRGVLRITGSQSWRSVRAVHKISIGNRSDDRHVRVTRDRRKVRATVYQHRHRKNQAEGGLKTQQVLVARSHDKHPVRDDDTRGRREGPMSSTRASRAVPTHGQTAFPFTVP